MQEVAVGHVVEVVGSFQADVDHGDRPITESGLVDVGHIHNELEKLDTAQCFRHPFFEQGRETLFCARLVRPPYRRHELFHAAPLP